MSRPRAAESAPLPTIEIHSVRVAELPAFAERALADGGAGAVVPLTMLRARAQHANPHAAPDDVALVVALERGRCVGYLGLLPARVALDGQAHPVSWMTTWYVAPALKGRGVGYLLLQRARALGRDLAGTAFSRDAERVMRQAGFQTFGPLEFLVLDLRRVAPLAAPVVPLRRRLRRLRRASGPLADAAWWLDRLLARPGKRAVLRAMIRNAERQAGDVRCDPVDVITEAAFGDNGAIDGGFVRDRDIVNWTMRYPWVSERGQATATSDYHFSHERRLFRRVALQLTRAHAAEPLGFALLSAATIRERTVVRLLDHRLPTAASRAAVLAAALRVALQYEADSVVLPLNFAAELERGRLARLLVSRQRRGYLHMGAGAASVIGARLQEIRLDYCDGDTALSA